jgi:hypothetical protein
LDFPSFGDATGYEQLGRACAEAVAGPAAVLDGCYHPVRPIGAAALMALPYVATDDPVSAAYIALASNIALFAAAVACFASALAGDPAILPARRRREAVLLGLAFAVLLPFFVSLIPVRLADIPSLAPFAGALLVGANTLHGAWSAAARRRRYALAGLLCAIAVLVNTRYFVYAFVLLAALAALDRDARGDRVRCAGAFVAGMAPVALQVLSVLLHTGQLGLYDREFMAARFAPRAHTIEAEYATLPAETAYMVQAPAGMGGLEVVAQRLFRGMTGFEWSVYHGHPRRPPAWAPDARERATAWAVALAYLALSAAVVRKAPPALRLLTLAAAPIALLNAVLVHTELRYYALPRSVFWLTVAVLLLRVMPRVRRDVSVG